MAKLCRDHDSKFHLSTSSKLKLRGRDLTLAVERERDRQKDRETGRQTDREIVCVGERERVPRPGRRARRCARGPERSPHTSRPPVVIN
jgi:hypothetical protein